MSEELESRVAELEDRVASLERAIVALASSPAKTMVIEKTAPVQRQEMWLNGIPQHRGCEFLGETFMVRWAEAAFKGGKLSD